MTKGSTSTTTTFPSVRALDSTARPCSPGDPSFQLSRGQVTRQKACKQVQLSQFQIMIGLLSLVMVRKTKLFLADIKYALVYDDLDGYWRVLVSFIKWNTQLFIPAMLQPDLTTKITRAMRCSPDWCVHIFPDWNKCAKNLPDTLRAKTFCESSALRATNLQYDHIHSVSYLSPYTAFPLHRQWQGRHYNFPG